MHPSCPIASFPDPDNREKRVLWYQLKIWKKLPMFQLNAWVFFRAKVKHSVETSAGFSDLKFASENSLFCLCRSQLRSSHFLMTGSGKETNCPAASRSQHFAVCTSARPLCNEAPPTGSWCTNSCAQMKPSLQNMWHSNGKKSSIQTSESSSKITPELIPGWPQRSSQSSQ